jgi:hypothetical protein
MAAGEPPGPREPWIKANAVSATAALPSEVVANRANIARMVAQRALAAVKAKRPGSNLGKRYTVDFRHRSKV